MTISGFTSARPAFVVFHGSDGREVFRIGPDGVLTPGPGLSDEAATREMFATMVRLFPEMMRDLASAEPKP